MNKGQHDDFSELERVVECNRDISQRLPVRVPGYPAPMVPLTMEERDELLRAWTDTEMARVRRPIVVQTGERDLDAEIDAVMPEQLFQRQPVMVDGQPEAVVLLTCGERHRIVQTIIRLGGRVRQLGDARSLREQIKLADDPDAYSLVSTFTDLIFDTGGLDAVPEVIDDLIYRLEQSADPAHFENANLLREVREKLRFRPTDKH